MKSKKQKVDLKILERLKKDIEKNNTLKNFYKVVDAIEEWNQKETGTDDLLFLIQKKMDIGVRK